MFKNNNINGINLDIYELKDAFINNEYNTETNQHPAIQDIDDIIDLQNGHITVKYPRMIIEPSKISLSKYTMELARAGRNLILWGDVDVRSSVTANDVYDITPKLLSKHLIVDDLYIRGALKIKNLRVTSKNISIIGGPTEIRDCKFEGEGGRLQLHGNYINFWKNVTFNGAVLKIMYNRAFMEYIREDIEDLDFDDFEEPFDVPPDLFERINIKAPNLEMLEIGSKKCLIRLFKEPTCELSKYIIHRYRLTKNHKSKNMPGWYISLDTYKKKYTHLL